MNDEKSHTVSSSPKLLLIIGEENTICPLICLQTFCNIALASHCHLTPINWCCFSILAFATPHSCKTTFISSLLLKIICSILSHIQKFVPSISCPRIAAWTSFWFIDPTILWADQPAKGNIMTKFKQNFKISQTSLWSYNTSTFSQTFHPQPIMTPESS